MSSAKGRSFAEVSMDEMAPIFVLHKSLKHARKTLLP